VAFKDLVHGLRQTERHLLMQLEGVRGAIAALEMGSAVSPALPGPRPAAVKAVRKRRRLSAKARAAISKAQKLRWAKQRAEKKS